MQIVISIVTNNITLPINYHHIQQGAIYSLMSDRDGGGAGIHDEGARYYDREYRLFTFGPFKGRYSVKDRRITFSGGVSFEVRSIDARLIQNIEENIKRKGIRLGDVTYHNVEVRVTDVVVDYDYARIKMISPICVYETDIDSGHTVYYNPWDKEFGVGVLANFIRKYTAANGCEPCGELEFDIIKAGLKDKYLTRYKGFLIEGWKGLYSLSGTPELISFLYNAGLGAKNSQGFGMFDII